MVKSKKILAFLLTAAMTLSLLPTFTLTASAEETATTEKNITLGTSALKGGQASNVYFGNYQQSSLGNTEPETGTEGVDWIQNSKGQINSQGAYYKKDPIKWRVLSNDGSKLFLLSDKNLDVVRYHEDDEAVTWATSTIRSWLNGYGASSNTGGESGIDYTSNNFIGSAFSENEKKEIVSTTVEENIQDKVFLLSVAEAQNTSCFADNDSRKAVNTAYVRGGGKTGASNMSEIGVADYWWLRSPGSGTKYAAHVLSDGGVDYYGRNVDRDYVAVRPAFNLNLSSVLFTSAADGKSATDGTLSANAENTGNEYKLTMLDSTRSFALTDTSEKIVKPNGSLSIDYTGANTGDNEYISAMLLNEDDEVLYYGQLAESTQADGTVSVALPSDLIYGKSYTLKLFNEQINGDKKTDFSSNFVNVTLKVELDGKGTETSPYLISNLADLEYFRNCVNNGNDYSGKYVKLSEDIDMSEKYNETTGESWTPIGNSSIQFKGTFDGNGKKIEGLYINVTQNVKGSGNGKGLFGYVTGGTIKNLSVDGAVKSVGNYIGGIVGKLTDGTIENCTNECAVEGRTSVGGVVGIALNDCTLKACTNNAKVDAKGQWKNEAYSGGSSIGGIVGYASSKTKVEYCRNFGNISAGGDSAGGIVGYATIDGEESAEISNCYSVGSITAQNNLGGIVGYDDAKNVTNCYYLETMINYNQKGTRKTAEEFASGEVAWLLNGSTSTGTLVWGQTLTGDNKDAYPVFGGSTVYQQASGNTYANSLITTAKITADAPSFDENTTMYDKDGKTATDFVYDENANVTTVYVKIDGAEDGVKPIIKITGDNGDVESQTWTAVNNIYYAQFIGDFADFGTIEVTYEGAESVTIPTTISTEEEL